MNTDLSTITTLTMSSKEIAELTGKRHDHVMRDIDNIINSLSPELGTGFKSSTYTDSTGKSNRMYKLDQDATHCLIAGYDANVRMRIVKRWRELESAIAVPTTFLEAMELVVSKEKERLQLLSLANELQAKISSDAPKVGFFDNIAPDQSSMTVSSFAKALSDAHLIKIGPNKLFQYLRERRYLMVGRDRDEHNKPYVQHSMAGNGLFDVTFGETFSGAIVPLTMITLKGQMLLAPEIIEYFKINTND